MSGCRGFSLIEMIIVVVLIGILAGVLTLIIEGPVRGYVAAEQRADLVDLADTALSRMTRELRLALPNSIRVDSSGSRVALEFLRVFEGARYRALPVSGGLPNCGVVVPGSGDPLEFTCADHRFDLLGRLNQPSALHTGTNCMDNNGFCVVVYNTGQVGANAYAADNLASLSAVNAGGAADGSDQLVLTNSALGGGLPAFPRASPAQRLYIVDGPVSFICDSAAGHVVRHAGYPIAALQSTAPGGDPALLVERVSGCDFQYAAGTHTRGGIATLRLTLEHPQLGEEVVLLQQVHVENLP